MSNRTLLKPPIGDFLNYVPVSVSNFYYAIVVRNGRRVCSRNSLKLSLFLDAIASLDREYDREGE